MNLPEPGEGLRWSRRLDTALPAPYDIAGDDHAEGQRAVEAAQARPAALEALEQGSPGGL